MLIHDNLVDRNPEFSSRFVNSRPRILDRHPVVEAGNSSNHIQATVPERSLLATFCGLVDRAQEQLLDLILDNWPEVCWYIAKIVENSGLRLSEESLHIG